MSYTVRVWCRECKGEEVFPVCPWCMGQRHEDVNPDDAQRLALVPWVDRLLPETPVRVRAHP